MKTNNFFNAALSAVKNKITGPAMQSTQATSRQMEHSPSSSPTRFPSPSHNQMPSWLRREFSSESDKEGSSSGINTEVKDLAVCNKVNPNALVPLENVYGGGPKEPVELIPDSEIMKLDGTFKYCVTKHRETNDLDVLLTPDVSAAHVGMKKIAEEKNCDVVMAGHVTLHAEEGKHTELYSFTSTSGHLQPEGNYDQLKAARIAFENKGLDARGRYMPRMWDENLERYRGKPIDSTNQGD